MLCINYWYIYRFYHCSKKVKLILFRCFCLCLCDLALWKYYSATALNKLRSACNKCIKIIFNFRRRDSMTSIFMELAFLTFGTVVHNSRVLFQNQLTRSTNSIVQWLVMLNVWYLFVACVFLVCFIACIAYICCRCVSFFFLILCGLCLK